MNIEELREYCLSKPAVEETFPFGPENMVFKVMDKVFLITGIDSVPLSFNVKCDPDMAEDLREKYDCVTPGYHMNKKHWNTVIVDNSVSEKLLRDWIDHSYNLIVDSLPKNKREVLRTMS
jgi:predicted DNA-binding protein (MmcQ/YjbR family)